MQMLEVNGYQEIMIEKSLKELLRITKELFTERE